MEMKFNPFQPNKIVSSGMFTGRGEEIITIDRCLFQAKNGNPQHFLIQGERGIGKSSLMYYVDVMAKGLIAIDKDTRISFLSVPVDLGACNNQSDIVRAIARGLKNAVAKHQAAKERAKEFWSWVTNWEVLGVRFHKDNPDVDPQDLIDELVQRIARLLLELGDSIDGIVMLIDEADQPSTEAGLGLFMKLFTERLTREDANSVLIGIAGLPQVLIKMRDSHESSPRIFQTLHLKPLEEDERRGVIRSGLAEAKRKNGFDVSIDNDAIDLIAELSEGYPHFVQQFSFSAFDADQDKIISVSDVLSGAFDENGAIHQLGRKYFNEMYFEKISSNEYRRVLDAMAEHADGWVSRKRLLVECGVKATTFNNAINALKARNIILIDDSRQGFYRLPTKSFAAWINAIKSVEEHAEIAKGAAVDRSTLF